MNADKHQEILRSFGMTTSEFLDEAVHFLSTRKAANSESMQGMPVKEARIMSAIGMPQPSPEQAQQARQANAARSAAVFSRMVAEAFTPGEVSGNIGVSPSRLRQRVGDGSLFAVDSAKGRVYPRFQFNHDGSEVAGMSRLLKLIEKDVYSLSLYNFMTLPDIDLENLTPVEWLSSGRDFNVLIPLAHEL